MFTGIIQNLGTLQNFERNSDAVRVFLNTGFKDLVLGESVAINGVCLTVAELTQEGVAAFFLSEETLSLTCLADLKAGSRVNLERALRPQDRISGHWVQGHVDGQARLVALDQETNDWKAEFEIPESLLRYCVVKGSIALDGVSLTINSILNRRVGITLIPHTWTHTRFSTMLIGERVNVEVDVLAKYMEKLCLPYLKPLNS